MFNNDMDSWHFLTIKSHRNLWSKKGVLLWVPVSSTSKVSDGWIRDLKFNSCLHQKLTDVLV